MLLCLHNRSSRAMLLKTEEVNKAFSVTENKTNSITDIFFLKYYLDLGLLHLSSWEFFFIISKKNCSKHFERLVLEEINVRSDLECLANSDFLKQEIITNCNSQILWSTKVKLVKSLAAMTLVWSRYSTS